MSKKTFIEDTDLDSFAEELTKVRILNTSEDVATLVDTFMKAKEEVGYYNFMDVVQTSSGYYFMVVNSTGGDFDLFDFISRTYGTSVSVNAVNVQLLFPEKLSRGIYDNEDATGEVEDVEPTSFMDESDLYDSTAEYSLISRNRNIDINIPFQGITIGRSSNKVDLLLKDNTNIGRTHCKLYVENGALKVHDFESRNGTFVNSQKVHSDTDIQIRKGDTLTLADEDFLIG